MAMSVKEIKKWLNTLMDGAEICIDDGGLTLQVVDDPEVYLEVGGDPVQDILTEWNERGEEIPCDKEEIPCDKCDNTGLLNTATNNTVDDEDEKPCDKCNGKGFLG